MKNSLSDSIAKLEKEISQKTAELDGLRDYYDKLKLENPQAITDYFHKQFCGWNHTDGCGYEYEKWSNPNHPTKSNWMAKTQLLIEFKNQNGIGGSIVDLIDFMRKVTR